MITGKSVFLCPVKHEDVMLHVDCITCEYYRHFGIVGNRPYVSCVEQKNKQAKTRRDNIEEWLEDVKKVSTSQYDLREVE